MQRFSLNEFDVELAITLLLQGDNDGFKSLFQQCAPNLQSMTNYHPSEVVPNDLDHAVSLLQIYRNTGKGNAAGRCALNMLELGFPPTSSTFNQVLSACARLGDLEMLWTWWGTLMFAGYKANLVSFNILLSACARARNQHQAECCIRSMLKLGKVPSLIGLSSLIDCFAKAGNVDKAEAWFKTVLALGMKPDVVAFNVLINAYANVGNIGKAASLVASMRDSGVRPDTKTYNCLIDACAKFRDSGQVERLLMHMDKDCVRADDHTFGSLINVYAKHGDLERCVFWLGRMAEAGFKPTATNYNMILHACAQRGDPQQAEQWLSHMEGQGVAPNGITYSSLLNAYSQVNDWDGVVNCVQRMACNRISIDHITLGLLLRPNYEKCCIAGQRRFWDAYCIVIRALLSVGDVKNLRSLLSEVRSKSFPENALATHEVFRQISAQTNSDAEFVRVLQMKLNSSNDNYNDNGRASRVRPSGFTEASTDAYSRLSRLLVEEEPVASKVIREGGRPVSSTHNRFERSMHQKKDRQPRRQQSYEASQANSAQMANCFHGNTSAGSTIAFSQSQSDDSSPSQDWNQTRSRCQSEFGGYTSGVLFL